MKLIREHINEKFIEHSDPIYDMGIGMEPYYKIKNVLIDLKKKYGGTYRLTYTPTAITGIYKHNPDNRKTYHTIKYILHEKKFFHLFPTPLYYKKQPTYWEIDSPDSFYKNVVSELNYSGFIKESLNEKFKEDSDPIKDLDIGLKGIYNNLKPNDIFKLKRNIPELGQLFKKGILVRIVDVQEAKPLFFTPKNKNEVWDKSIDYQLLEPDYSIIRSRSGWLWNFDFFKKYMEPYRIQESLNEKFEDESDPIEDMRIGTKWKEKLVLKFLNWVNNDYQMDPKSDEYWGYLNISLDKLRDSDLKEGFTEYVHNWPKYKDVLKKLDILVQGIPQLYETIFYRPI